MSRPTEDVVAGDEATLAARVEKVLALHPRSDVALGDCDPGDWCVEWDTPWPCLTVRLLDGADE